MCVNNNGPTYTYNQGMYVGAATLLYRITSNATYLAEAARTLSAVVHRLTSDGVLVEPFAHTKDAAPPPCSEDHEWAPRGLEPPTV